MPPATRGGQPKTAIFFPGQGVQRVGMTTDWLEAFPRTVKPMLEQLDETLKQPISKIIEQGPNSRLTATENAQPAIMWTSLIVLRVLEQEFGFRVNERVDVTLGHSLGEFAALVAGGYLRDTDALKLVRRRAETMAKCSKEAKEEVGMIALVCEADRLPAMVEAIHSFLGHTSEKTDDSHGDHEQPPPALRQVLIANVNSKNQIVLSGGIRAIQELMTHLRQFGGHDPRAVRLSSDSPFHSPLMRPAAELMKKMLYQPSPSQRDQDIVVWPGLMPCISNVSARPFQSKEQLKDLLARQCVETVLWHDSIVYLHQEEKVKRWIGIGPGKVGRNLVSVLRSRHFWCFPFMMLVLIQTLCVWRQVGKEVGMRGAVRGGGVWGVSSPKEIDEFLRDFESTESMQE